MPSKKKIIFIVGPTAVGKSDIAVRLAKKINAEIISCDSMQIYKKMDIITSKTSLILRRKVRHHAIGIISAQKEYNAYKYRKQAIKKIKEIVNKGKAPLFVGGTGLYMSTLIDGIFKTESRNLSIRNHLYKVAKHKGNDYLYEELKKVDADSALKIHPHDTKRIVRALEVFRIFGQPISELQKQRKGLDTEYALKIFCLNMQRSKLYKRIEERVDKMFARGLVNEVRKLLKLKLSRTATFAIGIKELKGYFDGLYDLEEAKRLIKRNSRNFAKRQLTWFRKDKRIKWIEVGEQEKPMQVAKRIWKKLS